MQIRATPAQSALICVSQLVIAWKRPTVQIGGSRTLSSRYGDRKA